MARGEPGVDEAAMLRIRRSKIDAVSAALADLGPGVAKAEVTDVLATGLGQSDLAFLDGLEGGHQGLAEQAAEEFVRFEPSRASSAASAAALVRILLLQSLDMAWWGAVPDFLDDRAVEQAPDMVDLRRLKRDGGVTFGFGVASDGLVHRGRDFLVHRLSPDREPRGPGLPYVRARPAMVSTLNEVAAITAQKAPGNTPPIWVNSIVRSVEHQKKLRRLGFSALLPSAHCRGWAADVEVEWFERFGAADVLREVLLSQLDAGVLNVIDEGRAWHVCLSPGHAARLSTAAISS